MKSDIENQQTSFPDSKQLRRQILALRDKLSPELRKLKSSKIEEHLCSVMAFQHAATIMLYASFRSEVATYSLMNWCLGKGKTLVLPVTAENHQLKVYPIGDIHKDLQPGYCSIPEPDHQRLQPIAPEIIDLVVVPGSVFDAKGHRLGYGGGYYDRFLVDRAPQAIRIGIAFELQIVPEVPAQDHDQRMDYIITEDRVIRTDR
ncbi:MAG: 5-formyltetrahydrofolate cyclo-ligase [Proteobacteria bacterium]|nr:5-formyltetrahydrofolate cyclo-ligase [Pseudomonadota bacterium]MBU1709756.1 5-formyltetrahydrofolate cyclo-ligase [Pseudomonadota bacterium]